jgi:hypothetical protein
MTYRIDFSPEQEAYLRWLAGLKPGEILTPQIVVDAVCVAAAVREALAGLAGLADERRLGDDP